MRSKRKTSNKQITALVKQEKIWDALRLARGSQKPDLAQRLIEQWKAVREMEDHPELISDAPAGFYDRALERAAMETWNAVRLAVRFDDPDFFLRMNEALKKPSPKRDELRVAVLSDMVPRLNAKGEPKPKRSAKEIAADLMRSNNTVSDAEQVRRLQRKWGRPTRRQIRLPRP